MTTAYRTAVEQFILLFKMRIQGIEFTQEQADKLILEIKTRTRLPREKS